MPNPVEITITAGNRRQRPGLLIHRAATLETTTRRGLRVTTIQQTLHDLGWPDRLTREALARGLIHNHGLPHDIEPAPTLSELERRMRRLCHHAGLPQPIAQHQIGAYRVDFAWLAHRVLVETDGYQTHGRRQAFEDDRARDAHLTAQGYLVLRFTWRQITREPYKAEQSAFAPYKAKIAGRAAEFGRPVLLFEGDSHVLTVDRPAGMPSNLTRVIVQGSTSVPHEWLRLHVDRKSASVFSCEIVPFGGDAHACPAPLGAD
jgi:very-short-patch-repair endonuclease